MITRPFSNPSYQKTIRASENPIAFSTFSGADMVAVLRIPDEYYDSGEVQKATYKEFAEIQTVSISSTRNVFPVRVLGRSAPAGYGRGARTIAGSLIFAQFSHDVFYEIYRMSPNQETFDARDPFFVDQLPEFDLIISAVNEHGVMANAIIGGITLVNTGTTLSIHDIYSEATFSYVAKWYVPLSENTDYMDKIKELASPSPPTTASSAAEAALKHPFDYSPETLP